MRSGSCVCAWSWNATPKEKFGARFKAKGHLTIDGPAINASVESDECHKAVSLLTDKLDRMLSRRAQLYRVKRHHPHAVEFGVAPAEGGLRLTT
jgi:ribosome-associated translation inhibitor RaiA